MSKSPKMPEKPVIPDPPPAPDMSLAYQSMVSSQQAQNKVSTAQLGIAKEQLEMARERSGAREGYRGVQRSTLESAGRGIDPMPREASTGNVIMQGINPALEVTGKNLSVSGHKADSPYSLGNSEAISLASGKLLGESRIGARQATQVDNFNRKISAVGGGAKIPQQAAAGLSAGSEVMSRGAATAHSANSAFANMATGVAQQTYQASMTQWQHQVDVMMNDYNYEMQKYQLKAQSRSGMFGSLGSAFGMIGAALMFVPGGQLAGAGMIAAGAGTTMYGSM